MQDDPANQGWQRHRVPGRFEDFVGGIWFRDQAGERRFGYRPAPEHCNSRGVVHGGMLMGFADHALGLAVWAAAGRTPLATVCLRCDFLGAAEAGEWIEATATLTRQTRSLVFARGTLTAGDRPVMTADGVWKLLGRT